MWTLQSKGQGQNTDGEEHPPVWSALLVLQSYMIFLILLTSLTTGLGIAHREVPTTSANVIWSAKTGALVERNRPYSRPRQPRPGPFRCLCRGENRRHGDPTAVSPTGLLLTNPT